MKILSRGAAKPSKRSALILLATGFSDQKEKECGKCESQGDLELASRLAIEDVAAACAREGTAARRRNRLVQQIAAPAGHERFAWRHRPVVLAVLGRVLLLIVRGGSVCAHEARNANHIHDEGSGE